MSDVNDSEEREAHQSADQLVRIPASRGGPAPGTAPATTPDARGRPLSALDRGFYEPRLGHDLAHVRLWGGRQSAADAERAGAVAFTVGSNIVFGDSVATLPAQDQSRLLAHELTHVVQHDRAPGSSPVVHRQPAPAPPLAPAPAPLDKASRQELENSGIQLAPADEARLAIGPSPRVPRPRADALPLTTTPSIVESYKLLGFRLVEPAPLERGVESWVFQVGKGRSILSSSIGGPGARLMDVGVGGIGVDPVAADRLVATIGRAVTVGGAAVPERSLMSHTDRDHLGALGFLMRDPAFARLTVEMTTEQVRSAVGQRDWSRLAITLNPAQQLIELQVSGPAATGQLVGPPGAEVNIRRTVVGNMELTEFRSVAAHTALTVPGRTYDKNRTSPVVIVTDLVSGERMLYTADGTGRLFNEVERRRRGRIRLLGAEGRQLRLAEYPHHGGAVRRGRRQRDRPDAATGVRGQRRQPAPDHPDQPAIRRRPFGVGPLSGPRGHQCRAGARRPSPAGRSEATRARGSQLERVTLDERQLVQALEVAKPQETEVMRAYQRLAEVREELRRIEPMRVALSRAGAPETLRTSVEQVRTDLITLEGQLTAATGASG